jgi:hypothetical protein
MSQLSDWKGHTCALRTREPRVFWEDTRQPPVVPICGMAYGRGTEVRTVDHTAYSGYSITTGTYHVPWVLPYHLVHVYHGTRVQSESCDITL